MQCRYLPGVTPYWGEGGCRSETSEGAIGFVNQPGFTLPDLRYTVGLIGAMRAWEHACFVTSKRRDERHRL